MPRTTDSKRPRPRPALWQVALLSLLLLLALIWVARRPTIWLTNQWRADLAAASDERLLPILRQAADVGEPGIVILAEALCSSRPALAEAAADVLDEELHRWAGRPPAETIGLRVALAEALAAHAGDMGPDEIAKAAEVAQRLLQWPADARAPSGRVPLACERVFSAASGQRSAFGLQR